MAATGKQIDLEHGVTQTVAGAFSLGGAAGNLLVLRSTLDGSEAFLDLDNAASGDFVDVKDVHATDQSVTLGPNSVDYGNAPGFDVAAAAVPALGMLALLTLGASLFVSAKRTLRS